MEVLTCCKHEDTQDVQQYRKIGMSLWSRSSVQEGLVLPFHEADEAPHGEQLLSKISSKTNEKKYVLVQTCGVKITGASVHLPEGVRHRETDAAIHRLRHSLSLQSLHGTWI